MSSLAFIRRISAGCIISGVAFAGALASNACVTERGSPAVSVSGADVYAPQDFHGRWASPGERIHFQPPPAPGFVRILLEDAAAPSGNAASGADPEERERQFFRIRRIDQLPEKRYRFHLAPYRAGDGLQPETRVFGWPEIGREGDRMLEYRDGGRTVVVWRRMR